MNWGRKRITFCLFFIFTILLTFSPDAFSQEKNIFKERRAKLASMIEKGIVIIQGSQRTQDNLYEHFAADSDNHDFIFLTGLETANATLILCPASQEYPEILYIDGNQEKIKKETEIRHVFPLKNLLPDLSNAYTDFSLMRYTQRVWKPLPSEIARILYNPEGKKVIYFNFPRFVNLAEAPPKRLELIKRIEFFSPKYELWDASDLLDTLRMYHDPYGIEQLRKATHITGEAIIECMKSATPGMSKDQLKSVFNFVAYFKGATGFGFSGSIDTEPKLPLENAPPQSKILKVGQLINMDVGAEVNHYTADIQRVFPVSGKFTDEQKKAYAAVKKAQEACIKMVKPGVTMKDLQDTAMRVLDQEGGYGKYFKWGTSHFLGMETHDVGNNLIPFKAGIVITVEPGIVLSEYNVILEDDILVTENGYEWLTEFIPRKIEDIEKVMKEEGIGEIFMKR